MPLSGHKYQYRKQCILPGDWSVQSFSPGGGPLIVRNLIRGLLHNKLFFCCFFFYHSRFQTCIPECNLFSAIRSSDTCLLATFIAWTLREGKEERKKLAWKLAVFEAVSLKVLEDAGGL